MWRVIQAGSGDADALSQVIAEAFHDLPPAHWLIADPDERRKIFPAYCRIIIDHAKAAGLVHTTEERAAVASCVRRNAAFSGQFLLGVLNPANELLAGQGRDVLPLVHTVWSFQDHGPDTQNRAAGAGHSEV